MRTNVTRFWDTRSLVAVSFSAALLAGVFVVGGFGCQSGGDIGAPAGTGSNKGKGGGSGKGGGTGNNGGGSGGDFTLPTVVPPSSLTCGNGKEDPNEKCDDANVNGKDGCSKTCQVEDGYECPKWGEPCILIAKCGDGKLTSTETCDDGNTSSGDGCSGDCQKVDDGYECRVPGKKCTPKCGDSKLTGSEACDDGNATSADGCSSTCQVEPGADCPKENVGKPCVKAECGNGKKEKNELCDCGTDPKSLPDGCKAVNGLFYGDGKGCSKTCTQEPTCQDSSGKTQACTSACGDGNMDPNEKCDDGNLADGDGCSAKCEIEDGFTCSNKSVPDTTPCKTGGGDCLMLPVTYRDFQPENVSSGGHPDFYFLGTKYNNSKAPTTICVPNSGGTVKGNDSTKRCWGIMGETLLKGKPQPGSTKTCDCQFSDWNIANTARIAGGYTQAANDSPLSDGAAGYQGGKAGTAVNTTSTTGAYAGTLLDYTKSDPGGPIWKGTTPAYKDAASLKQWFTDDSSVNKTFTDVIEMKSTGTNIYQYASTSHLGEGGFFPLDTLNATQKTLCNLWPYWNHGNGNPIWPAASCKGDQYLFTPRATASDCASSDSLDDGCWVIGVTGMTHDSYFTDEARYYFVYDGAAGISLSFYGDDDLFIFINGTLVLDLGGVHQQLPGKVTVSGSPGDAKVLEGGCVDAALNQVGASVGSTVCSPGNVTPALKAASGDDFRDRTVKLGLETGKVYEIAIFGADRHPPESNYQLTLQGFSTKKSDCGPRCGDAVTSGGEECDDGDDKNDDSAYGGCTKSCKFGPFCGDGITNGPEECDKGKDNGATYGKDGCTLGCTKPHFCGDGIVDATLGEDCDLGANNGKDGQPCTNGCVYIVIQQ
jgi:cysteine-rich repeat protein